MEFPLRYLIVIMKSITHLFFDRRLRKSSVLKCRTIVSINTLTKQNNRRRKEKTRHLAMMNSRRGEPRVLFITFYLINRKKKPSIENITRVKVYISSFMQARFICIHAGLYLACEAQTHFRSSLLSHRKIAFSNPSDKTISVT